MTSAFVSIRKLKNIISGKVYEKMFEMLKSKSKQKVTNENDVNSSKLPRSIQKSDNILGNTCKSSYNLYDIQVRILLIFFIVRRYQTSSWHVILNPVSLSLARES